MRVSFYEMFKARNALTMELDNDSKAICHRGGNRNYLYTRISFRFHLDFTKISQGFNASRGLLGDPRRFEEVLGRSTRSYRDPLGCSRSLQDAPGILEASVAWLALTRR